jgi:hypothetical protein
MTVPKFFPGGSGFRALPLDDKFGFWQVLTGPSSNGRTADFGSVNGGSNPPGPIALNRRYRRSYGGVATDALVAVLVNST